MFRSCRDPPRQDCIRTWHKDGYVHDRSTNPPSTTSTGQIQPPTDAIDECYARHDLATGRLAKEYQRIAIADTSAHFTVNLTGDHPNQRLEVWYTQPALVPALEARILCGAETAFICAGLTTMGTQFAWL